MSEFATPTGSMRGRIGRGAAWTAGGQMIRTATSIAQVLVLSHMLKPSDFGVVAMCAPILAFVVLFQDLGLSQAAIQKQSITHDEVNFLFWVNVGVSLLLALVLVAASPLVALFYGDNRVMALTAAMSSTVLLAGVTAQHAALLGRKMQFNRLAAIGSAGGVIGLVVAIVAALSDWSYWALFAGAFATAMSTAIGTWLASQWRPSRPKSNANAKELLHFGAGLTGFNLVNFVSRNLDGILIGRYWGSTELGYYDRANRLLLFPMSQVMNPMAQVMVPALSRMTDQPARYRNAFLKSLSAVLLVILPGVAFATATADLLIPLLLGSQWSETAEIFRALGFASLLQSVNNPAGWLFVSQGRTGEFMRWGIAGSVLVVIAFVAGLPFGAVGMAIGYAIAEYVKTPLLWLYIGRKGPVRTNDVLRSLGPFLLAAHGALLAAWLAHKYVAAGSMANLVISALACAAAYIAFVLLFPKSRRLVLELLSIARSQLGFAPAT